MSTSFNDLSGLLDQIDSASKADAAEKAALKTQIDDLTKKLSDANKQIEVLNTNAAVRQQRIDELTSHNIDISPLVERARGILAEYDYVEKAAKVQLQAPAAPVITVDSGSENKAAV